MKLIFKDLSGRSLGPLSPEGENSSPPLKQYENPSATLIENLGPDQPFWPLRNSKDHLAIQDVIVELVIHQMASF